MIPWQSTCICMTCRLPRRRRSRSISNRRSITPHGRKINLSLHQCCEHYICYFIALLDTHVNETLVKQVAKSRSHDIDQCFAQKRPCTRPLSKSKSTSATHVPDRIRLWYVQTVQTRTKITRYSVPTKRIKCVTFCKRPRHTNPKRLGGSADRACATSPRHEPRQSPRRLI